jgi:hypothetical protein
LTRWRALEHISERPGKTVSLEMDIPEAEQRTVE